MTFFVSTLRGLLQLAPFDDLAFSRVEMINAYKYRSFDIKQLSLEHAHRAWCEKMQRDGFAGLDPRDDFSRGVNRRTVPPTRPERAVRRDAAADVAPQDARLRERIDFVSTCPNAYFATDICLQNMRMCVPPNVPILRRFPFARLQDACREIEQRPMQARHVVELTGYAELFSAVSPP